ncbi:MAG: protein-L-isoaspartate(D-aspartate) O-methyltransferase [Candidatus Izemoplasmatales bacterium]|nr:protein-L-isoaspartate(D-aspartate) O-methyltransferase [Candidatus Izemoplasmatales bacterium]
MDSFDSALERMIQEQLIARNIRDRNLLTAFCQVKRHLFVGKEDVLVAYEDYPLSIGHNQTISQPYCIAIMLESLNLEEDDRVLEVGTGSGYQTGIMASIVKKVFSIEIIEQLHKKAMNILQGLGFTNIGLLWGNGYKGWEDEAPYDKIIVSCASPYVPDKLIAQLKVGGKMVIPVGGSHFQELYLITKLNDRISKVSLGTVRFVPMVDK